MPATGQAVRRLGRRDHGAVYPLFPRAMAAGDELMTEVRALAAELRLTVPSITYQCRRQGIETHRRLPKGAGGGQCVSFVADRDAKRIRDHYRDRLMTRTG